jgi:hypothetical protein
LGWVSSLTPRRNITLIEAPSTVTDPVTKFGGQPVWISHPQWPLSRELGEQMRFICQIALGDAPFCDDADDRLAYLFMTGGSEDEWADGTYLAEGGENAVVVQPKGAPPVVETIPAPEGPSLYRFKNGQDGSYAPVPCEYAVKLTPGEDPEHVPENDCLDWSDEEYLAYHEGLAGNKVGGTPGFLQGDEFPEDPGKPPEQEWRLLLQLDSTSVPFYVDFGDSGVGYAYLAEDGSKGRLLWQCC